MNSHLLSSKSKANNAGILGSYRIIFIPFLLLVSLLISSCGEGPIRQHEINLNYCLSKTDDGQSVKCSQSLPLKIPSIYYKSTSDRNGKVEDTQLLSVIYPSMAPWKKLEKNEQVESQSIEIEIHGVSKVTGRDQVNPYLMDNQFKKAPKQFYGLDSWINEGGFVGQILVPNNNGSDMFIRCGYSEKLSDQNTFGCTTYFIFIPSRLKINQFEKGIPHGLFISYTHKRLLLPHWEKINQDIVQLVESFVSDN